MKKIFFLLINLIVFIISISGCVKKNDYNFDKIVNSVEQIYIVEVQRDGYYGEITINYLMEVHEDVDVFMNDLESLNFQSSILLSPNNNTGINIMLVCDNEKYDYVIVGLKGIEEFKNNKQIYLYNALCDKDDFNEILNKYYK